MAIIRAEAEAEEDQQGFKAVVRQSTPRPATATEANHFLSHADDFEVGDIVKWRPGLADHLIPRVDDECVVTQVFDEPLLIKDERQPLQTYHMAVAVIVKDDNGEDLLVELPVDWRRVEYARDNDGNIKNTSNQES